MSYQTTRRWAKAAIISCALLLALASLSFAGTESVTEQWLVFNTLSDTAAPSNCTYDHDTLVVIPFRFMKADGDGTDTVMAIETQIIYDSDILQLQSVDVNSTNWPYTFSYTDTVAGDTNYIYMKFEDTTGVGIAANPQYLEMATMTFKFICSGNAETTDMNFRQGTNLNWVDYKYRGVYDPGMFIEGDAVLTHFWGDLTIYDTTVYNSIGDTIDIPVWYHNNFRTYYVISGVHFDTTALEYVNTYTPGGATYGTSFAQLDDQVLGTAWRITGFEGFESENVLVYHRFVLDCDAWGETLAFTFDDTTAAAPPCIYLSTDIDTEGGDLIYRDTAYYSAAVVGTDPRYYNDTITYDIKLTNSFTAGDITGSDGDTAGIVVNVNLGTFMEYDDVSTQYAQMDFVGTERDDYKVSVFQVIDDAKSNTISAGSDVTLVRMTTVMTGNPTTMPTWSNPYITGPSFVEMNDAAYDTAAVPGTVCDGEATYANGLLTWGAFPGAPAAVCLFYNLPDASFAGTCDTLDIFATANAAVDDVDVTLTVDSHLSIDDVVLATGITATQIAYNSLSFESNASFTGFNANDSVFIGSIIINCYSSLQNRYANIVYSDMAASDDSGNDLFTDGSAGAVFVRCDITCEDDDPVFDKPANGLPNTYALYQNYPNPFNPTTQIQLDLPEAATWHIEIYNVLGQMVKEFEGQSGAGTVSVEWDASNHSTGVYLYRATAGDYVETKKMLLLK